MLKGEHHDLFHNSFRIKYTELNEIYIFSTLRSLAFTFIAHFIPIYLFINKGDLQLVFLYYFLMYGMEGLLEPVAVKLIRHFGPKHTIAFSVPFLLLHFWFLQTLSVYDWPIWVLSISGSFALAFFWQAYHYDFSKAKRKNKATSDVSKHYILLNVTAVLAPIIGGYLLQNSGPIITFSIVIILLLIGTATLFKTGDKHSEDSKIDLKKLNWKRVRRDAVSYMGYTTEAFISMTVWPIFVYLIVGNYETVGLVTSVSIFTAVIVMYFVGRRADKGAKKRFFYIRFGAMAKSLIELLKILIRTIFGVYLANIAKSLGSAMFTAPWTSEYYLHADKESRSEYILIMEIATDLVRVLIAGTLIILSFYLPVKAVLVSGLLMASIGALLSAIIVPTNKLVEFKIEDLKILPRPQRREND